MLMQKMLRMETQYQKYYEKVIEETRAFKATLIAEYRAAIDKMTAETKINSIRIKRLETLSRPQIDAAARTLLDREREELIAHTHLSPLNESMSMFYRRVEEALKQKDQGLYQRWKTLSQYYQKLHTSVEEVTRTAILFFDGDDRTFLEQIYKQEYNKEFVVDDEGL